MNNINLINYVLKYFPKINTHLLTKNIIQNGDLNIIEYFYKTKLNHFYHKLINISFESNNLNVVKWFHNNFKFNTHSVIKAIKTENINIIKYMLDNDFNCTKTAFEVACSTGNLDIIKLIHDYEFYFGCNSEYTLIMNNAIVSNNNELVTYLYYNNYKFKNNSIIYAIHYSDLNMIKTIIDIGYNIYTCYEDVYYNVALSGNLEMLKYFKSMFEFNNNMFYAAAKNGKLECLQWLKDNNCPYSSNTYIGAINNGNIHNLNWLKNNNCPLCEGMYECAINLDNILVIDWLLNNNFTYENLIYMAIKKGNIDMIKFLDSKLNYEINKSILLTAVINNKNNCDIFRYYYESNKIILNESLFDIAVINNSLPNIEFLIKNNCPYNILTIHKKPIIENNLDILKLFHKYKLKLSDNVFNFAAYHLHLNILKWLFKNNYKFNNDTFITALNSTKYKCIDKIEVLDWFKNNNFPLDKKNIKIKDNIGLEWYKNNV